MNIFFKTIAVLSLSFGAMSSSATAVIYNGRSAVDDDLSDTEETATYESPQMSDKDLSAQARRTLETDPELSPKAQNVNVRVKNGHATVQGLVVNENEKDLIRQKVLAIEGIHSVSDKLKVSE